MITFTADELNRLTTEIFVALGASAEVAGRIAEGLVESNLVGHDSHGVIRIPAYVERARSGDLNLDGEIQIVHETPATARLDCRWNAGQVAAMRGMELAIAKARECGIGMVALGHCDHIGRAGEYVVQAAQQGMMGQVICNGSLPGGIVAPFGGRRAALGANPLAWAIPGAGEQPIFLDFATSIVAHGKLQVAADKGERVPDGWILDKYGNPTRDPNEMFDGGAILPFGEHKGYALGVLIELVAGGLSGAGIPLILPYRWEQGTVLTAVNVAAFQPLAEFKQTVAAFVERLKAIPPAEGFQEILLPGELEWRTRARRLEEGIPLPEKTWERIQQAAEAVGVPVPSS